MGNTMMSSDALYTVCVVAVNKDGSADVSWNGNRVTRWYRKELSRLRVSPPEWLRDPIRGTRCYVCRALASAGHTATCSHPRAVAARKRGAR